MKKTYSTERKICNVNKSHLDFMLEELWQRSQTSRANQEGFSHLRFLYGNEAASPVGLGILPYDWAKISRYHGFDSLKGNRFELILDSQGRGDGLTFSTFMVIEQKDQDFAQVYVNAWENLLVNPAPFLDIVDRRTYSYEPLKKNKGEYRSDLSMHWGYFKNRLSRGLNWRKFISRIKDSFGKK